MLNFPKYQKLDGTSGGQLVQPCAQVESQPEGCQDNVQKAFEFLQGWGLCISYLVSLNDSYKHWSRLSIFEKASRTILTTSELWNTQWLHCSLYRGVTWESGLRLHKTLEWFSYVLSLIFASFCVSYVSLGEICWGFSWAVVFFEFSIIFPVQPFYQTHNSLLIAFTASFQMLHLSHGFCWTIYLFFRKN